MATRDRSYTIAEGQLYKKGVVQPLLRCIYQEEGKALLAEIHSGVCGSHIGRRELSSKAIRQGFYWPTHVRDPKQVTKTCEACQNFSPHQAKPSVEIQLIPPIWPLQRWVMNLVGPLPPSQGGTNLQSCSWILHKMDWGKTTSINHLRFSEEIFLAKHSMQIQSAKNANS
jgi:hypothetical protein